MQITAYTVEEYLSQLPDERKAMLLGLRDTIIANLPTGFVETIANGAISYVVPHGIYPNGYHCNPKEALPFMSMASQKNFVAVYHLGLYLDESLKEWFVNEYAKYSEHKLDMGKSCIRFKKASHIPYTLMGQLASKMSVEAWISCYESVLNRAKKK